MPAQVKKPNKDALYFMLTVALCLVVGTSSAETGVKWAIIGATILLFILSRLGYLFFSLGAKELKKGSDKAYFYFAKALYFKIGREQRILIGTAFMMHGEVDKGILVLEKASKGMIAQNLYYLAQGNIALGRWKQGNLSEAISILEKLKERGCDETNMYLNLSTIYLQNGDLDKAAEILDHCRRTKKTGDGFTDNEGHLAILEGDWEKASKIYKKLLEKREPKFPEAYVHAAQVSIHEKDINKARGLLETALEKPFVFTSLYSKDYIRNLIEELGEPEEMDKRSREISLGIRGGE
ncbi:MAG: hypothetical protein J5800_07740 [Spirochaetales bacterium]|nr:hypothetical protein [Spirochaetales bacterium]